MPHHATVGSPGWPRRPLVNLLRWHDARPRASFDDARGWMWATLVAATFVWMSNPTVFIPSFYLSLGEAMAWAKVALVLSLPWLRLPRVPWPWLAFLSLAVLSHTWSLQPLYTQVSSTVYIQITVMAVLTAANCKPVVIGWGMAAGGVSVVLLSLYGLYMEVPGIEYSSVTGIVFGGIGTNENILAYTLVVSLAATLAVGLPRPRLAQGLWLGVLGIQLYGVYRAGSGMGYLTLVALGLTAVLVIGWPLVQVMSRRTLLALAGGGLALLVISLLFVTFVLDKELTTVSGRAPFWRATIGTTMELERWRGAGWGAVWEHPWDPAPPNHIALDIYRRAGFPLSHGHNFFLDVLPELGLLGLAVVLVMVAYAFREVRWCGLHDGAADPSAGRLLLFVTVALLTAGIAEPMLTVPLGWWSLTLVVALPRQGLLRLLGRPGTARAPYSEDRSGRRRAAQRESSRHAS